MTDRVWVERNKDGSWDAFSDEGAHIKFGKGRGQFDPGDLARIALAACAALSSQRAVEAAVGEGKGAKIVVDSRYDADTDSFLDFTEHVEIDASDANLSDEDAETLKKRVKAYIDKSCTIMHTYEQVTPVRMDVNVKR
ncbi:peroxiredoxin [Bifidobacterium dolichotidis]|uniref:Peroxiredoxin n=1 Tax=Bifidobacterium dolichotidis TaxID=2306976 RepID=A0A430FQ01_9BIFI|nr:OsmC family protein [Bifidobacterium dolichotidis]RSX54910.1 peroxiredoxin [Bifidobacterium dolichotidis]